MQKVVKSKGGRSGFVNFVYVIFLALLVALFWGMGISAFYESPKAPETPAAIEESYRLPQEENSPAQRKAQLDFDKQQKEHNDKVQIYNRNVSILALAFAVFTLVASLLVSGKIVVLPDGLLLGSLFTLAYSIIRGFASEDAKFRFVIVAIGLIITVFIGYWKFIKENKQKEA